FHNKRVIAGSPFDAQKAEPSQQKLTAKPALDPQRAELSWQHVKALNTQFASWVQSQLKNHPDELWQYGVQDYLTHALNIMVTSDVFSSTFEVFMVMNVQFVTEKFSDVVNWLKRNAVTGDSLSAAESYKNENKVVAEIKNSEAKYFQEKTGFTPISTTTSFSPGTTTPSFSPGTTTMNFSLCTTAKTFPLGTTSPSPTPADVAKKISPLSTTASFSSASSTTSLRPAGMTTSFTAADSKSSFTFGGTTAKFTSANTTTSFTSSGMTTSFATPWSSGIQSSVAVNNNASDDADEENELPQPSSPSVKKSEEKGIVFFHEVKCKLYVKSTDPADKDSWKDKGTGQLSIKRKEGIGKGSKDSKPTIVVRNDLCHFLDIYCLWKFDSCFNFYNLLLVAGGKGLTKCFALSRDLDECTNEFRCCNISYIGSPEERVLDRKLTSISILTVGSNIRTHYLDNGGNNGNAVARTFLIRTKSEEDRNKLATVIQEYAPASILLLYVLPWPACSGALVFPKAVMPIFRERLHYITVFPQQMQYKQR
ncbi:hypothetical protein Gotri_013268, partial [Gossypium trilobum]|nr:hypothetical protein [Gossypium trilobum]